MPQSPVQLSLKTVFTDLYKTITKEAAASLVFGVTAEVAKNFFNKENNFISKNVRAVRKGIEQAEHTILYNTLFFIGRVMKVKSDISHITCVALCSYMSSRKCGRLFALKSTILSLVSHIFWKINPLKL